MSKTKVQSREDVTKPFEEVYIIDEAANTIRGDSESTKYHEALTLVYLSLTEEQLERDDILDAFETLSELCDSLYNDDTGERRRIHQERVSKAVEDLQQLTRHIKEEEL